MGHLYTIGHSVLGWEDFVAWIDRVDIDLLIDVRSHPVSGKFPHFNRGELERQLGTRYIWESRLGGPTHGPYAGEKFPKHYVAEKLPQVGFARRWTSRGLFDYGIWMGESIHFKEGMNVLGMAALRYQRPTIMCAEALWWKCHRSMIADCWEARGGTAFHFMQRANAAVPHILGDRLERYTKRTQMLWHSNQLETVR